MFNRSKIIKKGDAMVTELEEECAKALLSFEQANAKLKDHLRTIVLNSAVEVEYDGADGAKAKYILIRIPFRSFAAYQKVGDKIVDHFESKFKWPVIVSANRTIISTHGKFQLTQRSFSNVQYS